MSVAINFIRLFLITIILGQVISLGRTISEYKRVYRYFVELEQSVVSVQRKNNKLLVRLEEIDSDQDKILSYLSYKKYRRVAPSINTKK